MSIAHFLGFMFIVFFTISCGEEISFSLGNQTAPLTKLIKGQVNPMMGLVSGKTDRWYSSLNAYASVCDADVSLYKLSAIGQKIQPAVATTTLDAQARFKFENLELTLVSDYSNYLIEVVGSGGGPCDVVYQRPLLGNFTQQDVNYSSTLLSFTLISQLPRKVHQVKGTEVEQLMNNLTGGNLQATFDQLLNQQHLRDEFFNLFGGNPEMLLEIPPTITSETIPSIISEEANHSFSISALHWSASYNIIIKWKLDGMTIQTTAIGVPFLYAPGKNDSGTHNLQAFIGKNDGQGELDTTYPYQIKSYQLLVNNNSLPIVPGFTLPGTYTNSTSVTASLNTGADLINCESFSSFLFTINGTTAPLASLISNPCTSAPQENISLSLGADGIYSIKLWVKDRSDLIVSSLPIVITKDTTSPVTQLSSVKSIYSSAETISLTLSASDNLGLSSLELFKSEDGGVNYSKVTDLNLTDTTYSLSAPTVSLSNFKIKLKATDQAGLVQETVLTLQIDVDAPAAPVLSLATSTPTNALSAQLSVTSCLDVTHVLIKESSSLPLNSDPNWQTCSTSLASLNHSISLGDGVKNLYAFARDAAGNISGASNVIQVTLDQTAPSVPTLAASPYSAFSSNNLQFTSPSCTDVTHLLISESLTTPIESNPAWQSCATSAGALTHTLSSNAEGEFTLNVWAKDGAGNISTMRNFNFFVDKTAPTLSSIKINDDDLYTGTSFVSLKVGAADNFNSIQVHFVEANATTGDCASEFNTNSEWYDWTSSTQEFSFALSNMDGVKKVCAWARDAANNISAIPLHDDIQFFVANPPKIVALNVYNPSNNSRVYTNGNNNLSIDWSISSTLDLPTNPLAIAYTTDGTIYKDIITDQDITDFSKMTWLGGIGSGLKSASGSYTSFPAPTSFFRIKVFVKDVSGNIGIPVISNIQNSGNWSIYAGTEDRGVGGAGKSAILRGGNASTTLIAIHPTTNDIYAYDFATGGGIRKLDARTGLVSTFIAHSSTTNLISNGYLPTKPTASLGSPTMYFDKNGLLYLTRINVDSINSLLVYQINPTTRAIKIYLPGGTDIGTGSTPPSTSQMNIARFLGMDEENSLYILQNCSPGSSIDASLVGHRKIKIVKVLQNPLTREAQEVINIAGNCGNPATPANGSIATESPLPAVTYVLYTNVIAWNGGSNIYFFDHTGVNNNYKILNNKFYAATTMQGVVSGLFNPSTGKIFVSRSSLGIGELNPNTINENGDTITSLSGPAANGCAEDEIPVTSSCPMAYTPPVQNAQGKIFFADGNVTNTVSPYRVRYISSDQKIKTIFGTKPLYGEGLSANLVRGQFGGIYYKKSTEPAQSSFPEGLYFVEATGPAFGYINPTSKLTSIIWGDQSFRSAPASGTVISNQASMGTPYAHINGQILTFDSNGFPWVGHTRSIFALDSSLTNTAKMVTSNPRYETRPDDSLITTTGSWVDGFQNNLQLSQSGLAFMLGGYDHTTAPTKPVIKAVNFGNSQNGEILLGTIKHVMGSPTTAGTSVDTIVDSVLPLNKTISLSCKDGGCKSFYDEINNRLYFLEDKSMRYITNPNSPSSSTLVTLFTHQIYFIGNFTLSPDMSTIYYTDRTAGKLYCHNITSTKPECSSGSSPAASTVLGPTDGATAISRVPNQFAWKDSNTLFISNFNGVIYEYKVP